MFHQFTGEVKRYGKDCFFVNDLFGIQVMYSGFQTSGTFFVFPYFDEQRKTFSYFAFEKYEQKEVFEVCLRISGVGPKTAFQIAQFPTAEINEAIENLDAKFFQSIPGIGPKSAKKIVLELKGNFKLSEAIEIDQDQKLFKSVAKSLQNLGFDKTRVKETLRNYPNKLTEENISEAVKWAIAEMS